MNAHAPRFDQAQLDDVRMREPLSAIFERFGHRVRRAGAEAVCLCPFHAERTPSCSIDDRKGVFHCHGCSVGGDAIEAVMRLQGCAFPDAIAYLGGSRAGRARRGPTRGAPRARGGCCRRPPAQRALR